MSTSPAKRVLIPLTLILAVGALLAGCSASKASRASSSSGATSAPAGGATASIVIKNFSFSPSDLTVAPGTKVTVTNQDTAVHTVTASAGGFDTGDVQPGQSKTFVAPSKAGTYPYICQIHQFMHGTLTVS